MESDHSKHGNAYGTILFFALFLCSSATLVCISATVVKIYNINSLERTIDKQQEEGVDPDYIDFLRSQLYYQKNNLINTIIGLGVSTGFLIGFILLEIVYLKAKTEPFQQEVSASERITQAMKNHSDN